MLVCERSKNEHICIGIIVGLNDVSGRANEWDAVFQNIIGSIFDYDRYVIDWYFYWGSKIALEVLRTTDAFPGSFHVALCCCWAQIEIFCDSLGSKVWAPFEVPMSNGF